MKKNTRDNKIIRFAGFLLGLILILFLLSIVFRRKDGLAVYDSLSVSVKSADIKAEQDNSLQILFYGDSECYASFSPEYLYSEYGYHSYVCGTAAQKICDSYAILYENFKTQSPRFVVLEANCLFRGLKGEEGGSDPVMDVLTDHVPVFAYHSAWKQLARKALPQSREKRRRSHKGFVVRKTVKPYKGGNYMKKTKKSSKIDEDILAYLEKMQILCKEHHATFLLVSAPAPRNWNYKKHNAVQKWSDSHDVTYIDLNLEDGLNINWKKDTKDAGDHLNLAGAKKVTAFMGEYFRDHYDSK